MTGKRRSAKADDVLAAGGIALAGSGKAADKPDGTDTVTARSYQHPVLDDRVVIRLIPETLGAAEDLAMEFLGFAPAGEPRPVGIGVRRALGFPAWALVNDPANGRHALAMVKEMERLARLAKSKPGTAKEGYDALAGRLDGAAPHFLPTFWEQAGRAFLAADNAKMAGTCFTRAREAERVHALAIDEDRLAQVHLEFALAGALPVKVVGQYARELAERLPADEAYRQLRTVSVHRVAGGLAPHAGMADELTRLAKAARLRTDAEAEGVIVELLTLPAVAKAPLAFWKSYQKSLVRLAAKDPAVRGRLLALLPDPPGWRTDISDGWIELLEQTGATGGLTGEVPAAAAPAGGAGAWLERFLRHRERVYDRKRCPGLISLVERMVPRLLAEGRALDAVTDPWRTDLDVLDVLIAGGVPVTDRDSGTLAVEGWLQDSVPGARDLAALSGYQGFAASWRAGVVSALSARRHQRYGEDPEPASEAYLEKLHSVAGIRDELRRWLAELAEEGQRLPLAALGDLIRRVTPLYSPAGAAVEPDAVRRFAAIDVAASLARTLRAGLADELTWPAYEEAVAQLSGKEKVRHLPAWPELIVTDGTRALVVGADAIVLDHMVRLPANRSRNQSWQLSYVDGQLLVRWYDRGWFGYWSDRPNEVFEIDDEGSSNGRHGAHAVPLPLPGGGVTTGDGRPWRAGDQVMPGRWVIASDGVDHWRLERVTDKWPPQWQWREFDPATGTVGRASRPRFFEEGGEGLDDSHCTLLPLPGVDGSPVGVVNGLVGWRIGTEPGAGTYIEGIDGRRVQLPRTDGGSLAAAVMLPGSTEPRAVSTRSLRYDSQPWLTLYEPETGAPASRCEVGRAAPPPGWWHSTRVRDEAGSLALRAMTTETAGALLRACERNEDGSTTMQYAAVAAELPAISDDVLCAAVAKQVARAAQHALWLAEFGRFADAAPVRATTATVDSLTMRASITGLTTHTYRWYGPAGVPDRTLPAISATAALLRGEPAALECDSSDIDWAVLLGAEGALALRAASPAFDQPVRDGALALVAALQRAGFVDHGGTLRVLRLVTTETPPPLGTVWRNGKRTLVITYHVRHAYPGSPESHVRAVEVSPDGSFGPVEGVTIDAERQPRGWGNAHSVAALAEQVAAHGPIQWRPELVDRLVARTGMTRGEAALLLAGLPCIESWEANFLPPPTRALLGLSVAEARVARDTLRELPARQRTALLDALMPVEPDRLWTDGPDVDRLVEVWAGLYGQRRALADDVLFEANRVIGGREATEIVRGLINPDSAGWLVPGTMSSLQLTPACVALIWLAYRLPADDPARTALPEAHQRLLAALRHPELTVSVGYGPPDLSVSPAVSVTRPGTGYAYYQIHPARLSGVDDPALTYFGTQHTVNAVRLLLSTEVGDLVAANLDEIGSGYPHDPRRSVPDVVEAVADRYGVSTDAAAYYLQLLALPDPTDKNVERWTGWATAARKHLRAELVKAELVVEAKRERAGRSAFVPGGWLTRGAPNLPFEQWKADLYEDSLPLLVTLRPVPALFRAAWQRVVDGDEPRLRSLQETS